MPLFPRWRALLAALLTWSAWMPASAATEGSAAPAEPVASSAMDAPLFYQLLLGEMELSAGRPGAAFDIILDAARRTRDPEVFKRAVDVALHARAGEQALVALRQWRQVQPGSLDAVRMQVQILSGMGRYADLSEPLTSLLALMPEAERSGLIAALPRFVQRAPDKVPMATLLDELLQTQAQVPATRSAATVARGRAWLLAGDADRAWQLLQQARQQDPEATGPVLLALDLIARQPQAEAQVTDYLRRPDAEPQVRLAYVRLLMGAQRFAEAITQLEVVTRQRPAMAAPYLSLGALRVELRHPQQAEVALRRYLELAQAAATPAAAPAASSAEADDDDVARADQGVIQARLLLAQAAEQRQDFAAAESWLAQIDDPKRALEVQTRRATLMARQGRIAEAREVVRRAPEREAGDARAKLLAEAGVLREVKRWGDAYEVLGSAVQKFPEDTDLLYEQAMVAEKLERLDEMERLLRRVIELKPDNAHAHNALGYSLADRRQRLPEARQLIQRALELSPGDPFITDSLGWVEYRMGNPAEAKRLLRQAYASRPDVEIAAHLGEVLWASGEREEARRVWREAKTRDAANDVLRETLSRLKADL